MGKPIVHFEISGRDPQKLRSYYGDLFGWEFDTTAPVAETISQRGNYGFVNRDTTDDGAGIPGGVWWRPELQQPCDLLRRRSQRRNHAPARRTPRRDARHGPSEEPGEGSRGRALHGP